MVPCMNEVMNVNTPFLPFRLRRFGDTIYKKRITIYFGNSFVLFDIKILVDSFVFPFDFVFVTLLKTILFPCLLPRVLRWRYNSDHEEFV